jgi:hypothetical protein
MFVFFIIDTAGSYVFNHHRRDQEEEAWRQLLSIAMRIQNMRAHIADCNEGSRSPVQPQLDYYAFNPYDPASVSALVPAVCKCLEAFSQNGTEG